MENELFSSGIGRSLTFSITTGPNQESGSKGKWSGKLQYLWELWPVSLPLWWSEPIFENEWCRSHVISYSHPIGRWVRTSTVAGTVTIPLCLSTALMSFIVFGVVLFTASIIVNSHMLTMVCIPSTCHPRWHDQVMASYGLVVHWSMDSDKWDASW